MDGVLRQQPQRHLTQMIGQPVGHQGVGLPGVTHLVGEPAPRNAAPCLAGFVAAGSRVTLVCHPAVPRGLHPIMTGKHAALRIRPGWSPKHPCRLRRWRWMPCPGAAPRPGRSGASMGGHGSPGLRRPGVRFGGSGAAMAFSGMKVAALAPKVARESTSLWNAGSSLPGVGLLETSAMS